MERKNNYAEKRKIKSENKFFVMRMKTAKILFFIPILIIVYNLIPVRRKKFQFDYWEQERLCNTYQITRWYRSKNDPNDLLAKFEDYNKKIIQYPHSIISEFLNVPSRGQFSSKDLRHIEPLIIAAVITNGDILDLAIDVHTTQVLRNVVLEQSRFLLSIENDMNWLKNFVEWNNTDNHLLLSSNLNSLCISSIKRVKKWGLLSVDHLNEFRNEQIIKYVNTTQILFIHNSDKYTSVSFERFFRYNCKSLLNFDDGTYSGIYFYTNLKEKFDILEKSLENLVLKNSKYLCSSYDWRF